MYFLRKKVQQRKRHVFTVYVRHPFRVNLVIGRISDWDTFKNAFNIQVARRINNIVAGLIGLTRDSPTHAKNNNSFFSQQIRDQVDFFLIVFKNTVTVFKNSCTVTASICRARIFNYERFCNQIFNYRGKADRTATPNSKTHTKRYFDYRRASNACRNCN